jgi:hypothetical protein
MKQVRIFTLLMVAMLVLTLAACGQEQVEAPELLAPDAFAITMEPAGHWHVFSPKTLLFNITDAASGEGVAGLDLTVQIAQADSASVRERSVSEGDVTDEGDGLYALEYTPSSIGSYSIAANFVKDGQHFASAPVALEISKAGEEGIEASANGTDYVYQIRYHVEPGHIHANDSEPVKVVFELMRGIQTGDDINWEQPWTNTFDHVNAVENAEIKLTSEDGAVSDTLTATYKGRGIWEAERVFSVAEVGEGKEYTINCSFTDAANGAQVTHAEPFHLHASAAH